MCGVVIGIGVVVPYDFALDRELWRWTPEAATLHLTRTPHLPLPVGVAQAAALGEPGVVAAGVRGLSAVGPDVVAYACTAGSFADGSAGERALAAAMRDAGAPTAVTTSGALVSALRALGVTRVAVATPYAADVAALLSAFLEGTGTRVTGSRHLGLTGRIWTVPQETTADLVRRTVTDDAEAVVVACTNLPTYDVIAPLEAELGIPVVTANQVTMWAALAAAGLRATGPRQRLLAVRPGAGAVLAEGAVRP